MSLMLTTELVKENYEQAHCRLQSERPSMLPKFSYRHSTESSSVISILIFGGLKLILLRRAQNRRRLRVRIVHYLLNWKSKTNPVQICSESRTKPQLSIWLSKRISQKKLSNRLFLEMGYLRLLALVTINYSWFIYANSYSRVLRSFEG